jgi:hypothetical protein
LRLANEHGCSVTQQQAAAFLNQEGHAYEMWKHMMQAGEEFIASSLLQTMNSANSANHIHRIIESPYTVMAIMKCNPVPSFAWNRFSHMP